MPLTMPAPIKIVSNIKKRPVFFLGVFLSLFLGQNNQAWCSSAQIIGSLDIDSQNISGIVLNARFLALATDEGNALQILPRTSQGFQATSAGVIPLTTATDELDIEGLAWQKPYLYAIGSHSRKRKKIKADNSTAKNMARLDHVIREPAREALFRIQLDDHLKVRKIDRLSLMPWIRADAILAPFLQMASKENGIDIEGISADGAHLYIGFRGPVIRGNLTPIMKLTLKKKRFAIKKVKVKWLNLGGFGIRDMVHLANGFTLLTGPVNQTPNQYQLIHWDGKFHFSLLSVMRKLATPTAKPEGLAWDGQHYWLIQDGLKDGGLKQLR